MILLNTDLKSEMNLESRVKSLMSRFWMFHPNQKDQLSSVTFDEINALSLGKHQLKTVELHSVTTLLNDEKQVDSVGLWFVTILNTLT